MNLDESYGFANMRQRPSQDGITAVQFAGHSTYTWRKSSNIAILSVFYHCAQADHAIFLPGGLCGGAPCEGVAIAAISQVFHHLGEIALARGVAIEWQALRRQHSFGCAGNDSARQALLGR